VLSLRSLLSTMSASTLNRVLRLHRTTHSPALSTTHRAYSSFFSSNKSGGGGGRYINPAKLPKAVVPGNKGNANKSKQGDAATPETAPVDTVHTRQASSAISTSPEQAEASGDTASPSSESTNASTRSQDSTSSSPLLESNAHERSLHALLRDPQQLSHPSITAKDFKINQFFSLHRPLLLLSTPGSILDSPPADSAFGPTPAVDSVLEGINTSTGGRSIWLLDESPEATLDADAVAARQLARALTVTHAGAAVAWEDTMRRLGLDVDKDAARVEMKEQLDKDLEEVMMDSTKRKRKKKMKKHKSVFFPEV
jgi:hypothetical protein